MIVLMGLYCAPSFLRRSRPYDLVYSYLMGVRESPGCVGGDDYCVEEGEGRSDGCSDQIFFTHWDQMPLYIDDYPYSGMSYCGDLDLPLPPGQVWGLDGK